MLTTTLAPRTGPLPRVVWRWEAETDILSGTTRVATPGESAAAVEMSSPDGAVLVLDVIGGELCGLDIVIWPDVETVPSLDTPAHPEPGRVLLPADLGARQEEEELAMRVDGPERTFHLRVGPDRPATVVQVADHLLVEVDAEGSLAGFWLTGVPPFPSEE
jgi:hypothetical protein